MGYPRNFTKALAKKEPSTLEELEKMEDVRCAALGNSFHTNTVAAILDQIFAGRGLKKPKGAKKIVEEFNELNR